MIKILNLYAGIGGNRKLWNGNIKVVAVEIDKEIAKIYQDFFPEDEVIVADAHEFLLENFQEFDFIWSSPPCQTHSRARFWGWEKNGKKPCYPDMSLYQEIIFLKHHFSGKWVVENVIPYYEPLINPSIRIGRHLFWSNFEIPPLSMKFEYPKDNLKRMQEIYGFNLSKYRLNGKLKRTILRNIVHPEIGLHIFKLAFKGVFDDEKKES